MKQSLLLLLVIVSMVSWHPAKTPKFAEIQSSFTISKIEKTEIGDVAADFQQPQADGTLIKLSSFRGKYVLIDFWASWCGPCRMENPNVVTAYNRFKPFGLEIIGVSLDDNRTAWLKSIKADKLEWIQVSDLKGWENAAAVNYGIRGIPFNLLLDKNGVIIAKDLRGDDLQKKLKEIYPGI